MRSDSREREKGGGFLEGRKIWEGWEKEMEEMENVDSKGFPERMEKMENVDLKDFPD